MMNLARSVIVAAIIAVTPSLTWAQADVVQSAQKASIALRAATAALEGADEAEDRVRALTKTIRAYENGLNAMRAGLRGVSIRERSLRLKFESQRDQISRLLGILQTLERATTPLLLIHPTGPVGTARSGMMLSEITPGLQKQAEALRFQLEELSSIQVTQQIAQDDLSEGLKGLNKARVALSQAIASRTDLPQRILDNPEHVQRLAQTSLTLDNFANALINQEIGATPGTILQFEDGIGKIQLPANGSIFRKFNQTDAAGIERPGILLATPALSLLTAPWASTVRYSGPFLDYGNVIILEPDPAYLIVLSGMSRIYVVAGDIVSKDDPIGLMSGKELELGDLLVEVSQASETLAQETLYIEIRKNGKPIDPIDWFQVNKG
jgi:septal ring factor EnvC (AmiA/AmiB activator)